jgi:K+-transporting ATPase ATPase B chain
MKNQSQTLFQKDLVNEAIKQSFVKLNPKIMFKNPVMFLVEIGTVVMLIVSMFSLTGDKSQGSFSYNFLVFIILFFTVLFANFAEAIAEARGKAQADTLRKTREKLLQKLS